jgi:hypothetical protein
MVRSYRGRLCAMRINCEPMTPATAANDSANTSTAANTERVCPRPRRRSVRTRGAINKLKIMARVIGTNTPRATYSMANTDAVAMTPKARSRFASGKGPGTEGAGDSMRYILTLPGPAR